MLAARYAEWQIEYLSALRAGDLTTATDLVEELQGAVDRIATGLADPLLTVATWASEELEHRHDARPSGRKPRLASRISMVSSSVAHLTFEVLRPLELLIYAGKSRVGHLVDLPKPAEHGPSDLIRIDAGTVAASQRFNLGNHRLEFLAVDRTVGQGALETGTNLLYLERFQSAVPFANHQRDHTSFVGRKSVIASLAHGRRRIAEPSSIGRLSITRVREEAQKGHCMSHRGYPIRRGGDPATGCTLRSRVEQPVDLRYGSCCLPSGSCA